MVPLFCLEFMDPALISAQLVTLPQEQQQLQSLENGCLLCRVQHPLERVSIRVEDAIPCTVQYYWTVQIRSGTLSTSPAIAYGSVAAATRNFLMEFVELMLRIRRTHVRLGEFLSVPPSHFDQDSPSYYTRRPVKLVGQPVLGTGKTHCPCKH